MKQKRSTLVTIVLGVAAIAGLAVGGGLTFAPEWFQASYGIEVSGEPNEMSEWRGIGGGVLFATAIVTYALATGRRRFTGLALATTVMLGWFLGRVIAAVADGMPDTPLLVVAGLEAVFGGLGLYSMLTFKEDELAG